MTKADEKTERPEADAGEIGGLPAELGPIGSMPLAMRIWFDDRLFNRAKTVAHYIAKAQGFTPPHLVGNPEACFAVVVRALTWKLDPYAVAMATYATPNGRVGFEGKLCQAIIESSNKLEGGVTFEYVGDWSRVQGKFQIKTSSKGHPFPASAWKPEDEIGLGVIVRAKLKGEVEPRELQFDLVQAYPRNSTLWATDPKTQIRYAAVRRFGSAAVPSLFMGVPFDHDDMPPIGPDRAIDVTPRRPSRADFDPAAAGHADPDSAFRAATSGRMPDTPEERGEAEEAAGAQDADAPADGAGAKAEATAKAEAKAEHKATAEDAATSPAAEQKPEPEPDKPAEGAAVAAQDAPKDQPAAEPGQAAEAAQAAAEPAPDDSEAMFEDLMSDLANAASGEIDEWWSGRANKRIVALAATRPDLYAKLLAQANTRKKQAPRRR